MAIELIEPAGFVWCIAGVHVQESLEAIVVRKQRDIEQYGWCLWAYGGAGNAHPELQVRRLAADLGPGYHRLTVLMPTTGVKSPPGVAFDGYRETISGSITDLPTGMSPVTGGARSWAFVLSSLEVRQVSVDLSAYVAPYAGKGPTPLPEYLRGAHGRAVARRAESPASTPVARVVDLVAEAAPPYAVYLARH